MGEFTKDIYVKSFVGNNLLRKAREECGYATKAALAEASGVTQRIVGLLENFKMSPRKIHPLSRQDNGWRLAVEKISTVLGVSPEDIFPKSLWSLKGKGPIIREYSLQESLALMGEHTLKMIESPHDIYERNERDRLIDDAVRNLTAREERVIRMRFGIGSEEAMRLDDIGKEFEVTRERVRQIETKALRKLRHPRNTGHIRAYFDPNYEPINKPQRFVGPPAPKIKVKPGRKVGCKMSEEDYAKYMKARHGKIYKDGNWITIRRKS